MQRFKPARAHHSNAARCIEQLSFLIAALDEPGVHEDPTVPHEIFPVPMSTDPGNKLALWNMPSTRRSIALRVSVASARRVSA
jgi:hypothetical protein